MNATGTKQLEIGEVRMSYQGAAMDSARAERISRLTFDRLASMAETGLRGLDRDLSIERLDVAPVGVQLEIMGDDEIAQAGADAIFRALLAAI
jgi:hypothetical protein